MIRLRDDPVLGELTQALRHLATTTDPASPADRVDVDAERTRRIEDRRALREPPAAPRRREDDERVVGHGEGSLADGDGAAIDPAAADLALGGRGTIDRDPAATVGVVAHQDVGR